MASSSTPFRIQRLPNMLMCATVTGSFGTSRPLMLREVWASVGLDFQPSGRLVGLPDTRFEWQITKRGFPYSCKVTV